MDPVGKEIKVQSDKTIVGSGTSGHIVGGGFFLGQGVHNVIIRNLTIRDAYQGVWNDKDHDFDAIQWTVRTTSGSTTTICGTWRTASSTSARTPPT